MTKNDLWWLVESFGWPLITFDNEKILWGGNVSIRFSTSRVQDEWFQEFWSMSDGENQYSHFRPHSIHIVESHKSCESRG